MTRHVLVLLVVVPMLGLGSWAGAVEPTSEERALDVLREALADGEERARILAFERAAPLREPGLLEIARAAARSNDRLIRTYGLELVASIDARGNRELFVEALSAPFRTVRVRGLRTLLSLQDPSLTPRFIDVLEKDPDPDLRALAARGIGALGGPGARGALRKALADPHPVVQEAAVDGLVARGTLDIGFELLDRARTAAEAEASRLLRLVGRVPNPALVPELAELLDSENPVVRVAAAAALLEIVGRSR